MTVYLIILFAIAVIFLILGIELNKGRIDLIHDYHQTNVKEADRKTTEKPMRPPCSRSPRPWLSAACWRCSAIPYC